MNSLRESLVNQYTTEALICIEELNEHLQGKGYDSVDDFTEHFNLFQAWVFGGILNNFALEGFDGSGKLKKEVVDDVLKNIKPALEGLLLDASRSIDDFNTDKFFEDILEVYS